MTGRSAQTTCRHGWPATGSGAIVCDLIPSAATEDDDMLRRDLFTGGLTALAVTATGGLARAQEKYPNRTVRLIVPTAAGGVYDLMGRLFIDRVAASLGTAIVENRAGGNA